MLHFKLLSALAFVCLPAAADTVNELAVTHVDSTLSDVARTPRKVGQFFQQANPSIKFGGYIMTKYSISDRSGQKSNGGFDLRFVRLYLDGTVPQCAELSVDDTLCLRCTIENWNLEQGSTNDESQDQNMGRDQSQ